MKLLSVVFLILAAASVPTDPRIDPVIRNTQTAIEEAYQEEVDRAMKFAPEGKSIYQLRGDAQMRAQELFKKAAELYDIPEYEISGLRWDLRDDRAGAATQCVDGPPYVISMNEILFLRNYDEMIKQTIVHEVAHIVTCLRHPELGRSAEYLPHGSEWQAIIQDLGGLPDQFHNMDTRPLVLYHLRVDVILLTYIVENE